jgi:hypothetical protein
LIKGGDYTRDLGFETLGKWKGMWIKKGKDLFSVVTVLFGHISKLSCLDLERRCGSFHTLYEGAQLQNKLQWPLFGTGLNPQLAYWSPLK